MRGLNKKLKKMDLIKIGKKRLFISILFFFVLLIFFNIYKVPLKRMIFSFHREHYFRQQIDNESYLNSIATIAETFLGPIGSIIQNTDQWPEIRRKIKENISFFLGEPPLGSTPLTSQILSSEVFKKYNRLKVTYQAQEGDIIYAYLLIPRKAPFPRPAILALHQTVPQGKLEPVGIKGAPELAYALRLVEEGFVVLTPDVFCAGERIGEGEIPFDTAKFYSKYPNWSAIGKILRDNIRSIDFLISLREVDKNKIGVIGHSFGGYNALFLAAFDERIKTVAVNCAYTRIETDPGKERWCRDNWFIHFPRLRPYLKEDNKIPLPWDFQHILALIAPRPIFQSFALKDEIFPYSCSAAQIHQVILPLYQKYGHKEDLQTIYFLDNHRFPPEILRQAINFIKAHLN